MGSSFIPLTDAVEPAWDKVVRNSLDGWVFGLAGWQRLVREVEPWGFVERGFAIEENGRLVAVMPLHYRPKARVLASSGWGGCGPVISGGVSLPDRQRLFRACLNRCIEIARELGAESFNVSCSPVTASSLSNRWAVNPFALAGLDDTSLIAHVIALESSEDALWQGLSKTARNLARRADKEGFRVETVNWGEALDEYYEAHVETYARSALAPHPRDYFGGIARYIAPQGAARLYALVSPAGNRVAFHNSALLGPGAYYHTGCSRTAAHNESGGYLLMWEAIKRAKAAGALWYDCGWIFPGTSDAKQQGLTLFKTRFGGEPHRSFQAQVAIAASGAVETSPVPAARMAVLSAHRVKRLAARLRRMAAGAR